MRHGYLFLFFLAVLLLSCHKKDGVRPVTKPGPALIYHQDGEVKQLLYNDPNGVNIVVLGDAFIKDDLDTGGYYDQQVKNTIDFLFSVAPFKQNKQHFNIYVVYAESNNRGAASIYPIDITRTKFTSYFDANVTRLLIVGNPDMADTYIKKAVPLEQAHLVLVLVNDPRYGGSGGYYSTTSVNPDSKYIMIHEIGHSFGGLTDEYIDEELAASTTRAGATIYPNTDTTNDPKKIKWAHFLDQNAYKGTVSEFQGGYYFATGVYRPEQGSIMQAFNFINYNAPSREAIVRKIDTIIHIPFNFNEFLKTDSASARPVPALGLANGPVRLQPISHDFIGGMDRMHWLKINKKIKPGE